MGVFSVFAFLSGPLYERYGGRLLLLIGAACLPAGLPLLSLPGESARYPSLIAGLVVAGMGVGLFYSTITTVAVTALDSARAGLAGGVLYMCQIAGGSVGLGLTTTVFTAAALSHVHADRAADRLTDAQEHAVGQILSGADSGIAVQRAFPDLAAHLEQLARDAMSLAVHTALRLDVALAIAGLVVVILFVGRPAKPGARRAATPEQAPEPAEA
jgi:MFS family permease